MEIYENFLNLNLKFWHKKVKKSKKNIHLQYLRLKNNYCFVKFKIITFPI